MSARDLAQDNQEERAEVIIHTSDLEQGETYRVWASDNQVYGPIPLSILTEWVQDRRVLANTWIYVESLSAWCQADKIPALKDALPPSEDTMFLKHQCLEQNGVDPQELRQFPVLAGLTNHDLAHLIRLAEMVEIGSGEYVIHRREPGDAIFFVLTGNLRASIRVGHDEKILNKIPAGQFFGEMSMFTHTPRTADVITEEPTRLLRFSAEAFRTLMTENPSAAAPMLYAISSTMARRILDTNVKFQTEVASGFVWR